MNLILPLAVESPLAQCPLLSPLLPGADHQKKLAGNIFHFHFIITTRNNHPQVLKVFFPQPKTEMQIIHECAFVTKKAQFTFSSNIIACSLWFN